MTSKTKKSRLEAKKQIATLLKDLTEAEKHNQDIVIGTDKLKWDRDRLIISEAPGHTGSIDTMTTDISLRQLAKKLELPIAYLRKCAPDIREYIINRELPSCSESRFLLRLTEREAGLETRAIMKQNAEPLDFTTMANIALKVIDDLDGFNFEIDRGQDGPKSEAWNLRLIVPETFVEIDADEEKIGFGLDFRTSEAGLFNPSIEPLLWQLVCANGLKAWSGDARENQMERFRHYQINTEEFAQRIVAFTSDRLVEFTAKQEALRVATTVQVEVEKAETLFMDTLQKAHVAGGAANREALIERFRRNKTDKGYNLYQMVSELTEIARDHNSNPAAEDQMKLMTSVDMIERESALILERLVA